MEPKPGDRISIDPKKVGQPRRTGQVKSVVKGLAGVRYQVRWDDGTESLIAPQAGVLLVEKDRGRNRGNGNPSRARARATPAKAATKKGARRR